MPEVIARNCAVCQQPLEALMASLGMMSHPACSVADMPPEPVVTVENPFTGPNDSRLPEVSENLRAELITAVRMFEEFTPRTRQIMPGPSDLGTECDRRLSYKLAGIQGFNHGDPWAAFVGSAIHQRIGNVLTAYNRDNPGNAWLIEERVAVDPLISGSADLVRGTMVADIKSASVEVMKKLPDEGPRGSYLPQVHAYAKGLIARGMPIDTVAFVFVPRSGKLTDMYVWADTYRPDIVDKALARVYQLARNLDQMDILNHPERWEEVPATPDFMWCQYCPLFNRDWGANQPATDKGCAGWKIKK